MIFIYNTLALILSPVLGVLAVIYYIRHPHKRPFLLSRFGLGSPPPPVFPRDQLVIWVHALSVGEFTSSMALINAIKKRYPRASVLVSTTTLSGYELAKKSLEGSTTTLIPFPIDFYPVLRRYINRVKPDLFVLVETDFWPNFLSLLTKNHIPAILVNGRISDRSIRKYRYFSFWFRSLFDAFTLLCMQTRRDAEKVSSLGINPEKIFTLGNLKHTSKQASDPILSTVKRPTSFPDDKLIIICGSTHEGEEKIILDAVAMLAEMHNIVHLAIAPRHISRSDQLIDLVGTYRLSASLFSEQSTHPTDVTIIDTIGDLPTLYGFADIGIIGGSFIKEGGHNPLEAARYGLPIIYGPHMDDFSEISRELLDCGAARTATDHLTLHEVLTHLINDHTARIHNGNKAREYIAGHDDVVAKHLYHIGRFV